MKYDVMEMTMSDGNVNYVHSWVPDSEPKAVVLLSHGMAEHAARYDRLGNLLTEQGYALYAEDHRGHGKTARLAKEKGTGDFGYLADKDGFFRVVDDIHEEALYLRDKYKNSKLFLLGHSFGSFVTQCFIEKYGDCLDGVVICGTAGPRKAVVGTAKCVGGIIKTFHGKRYYSKFMDHLAFGAYNAKIKNPRTAFDWLSRDNENVDKYIADEWCGFLCSIGFFCDMFAGLSFIHKNGNMKKVPADLPVLFIDGTADPVGGYSKTVQNLANIYRKNGVKEVNLKLYEGARHELFNETNREEVEKDFMDFISAHL